VLAWLASRQRTHAQLQPSYAEAGCWAALARLRAADAVAHAQGLEAAQASAGAREAAEGAREAAQGLRRAQLAAAVRQSRHALAQALPVWALAPLPRHHPGRVPPLLAAALVARGDCSSTQKSTEANAESAAAAAGALEAAAVAHVRDALRVHHVAYGGGAALFRLRYPSAELHQLLNLAEAEDLGGGNTETLRRSSELNHIN
jgi:hypothetical protein